jgi:hypothetical protein
MKAYKRYASLFYHITRRQRRNMKNISTLLVLVVMVIIIGTAPAACSSNEEVAKPMDEVLKADSRNAGVGMAAYYGKSNTVLVLDMKSIDSTKSTADVFRVLLQYAAKVKDKTFDHVELAVKGKTKFSLKGDFFHKLGIEYGSQNPVYTMRTFPQNVFKPDGTNAFPTWTGGLLGVTNKQMEDFKQFHMQWYITELIQ